MRQKAARLLGRLASQRTWTSVIDTDPEFGDSEKRLAGRMLDVVMGDAWMDKDNYALYYAAAESLLMDGTP